MIITTYQCIFSTFHKLSQFIYTKHTPADRDECYLNTDGCQQECLNTAGSYVCFCRTGYELTSNGYLCNGTGCLSYVQHIYLIIIILYCHVCC